MRRAVIDQPGARVLVIGLVLSAFLGLALRSQISESRIQAFLAKSIDRLQADFYIDYESAKVNLSRWGLPLPALIIQNLRLSPKSTICQSSQIFIEELEVPISVSVLLGFSKTIPKFRIKEIELRLSDIQECIGQRKSEKPEEYAYAPAIDTGVNKTDTGNLRNVFSNSTRAELKEIYIEKLKIISKSKPDQPVLLKQINLELAYTENRLSEVQIRSKISALKDSRSDVYFLNSALVAIIKSPEKNQVESVININGKLLDGDIQLFAHSFSGSNKVNYELGLQQVSIKALSPLIESNEFLKSLNPEKTPISITLKNSGELLFAGKPNFVSKFKKVQVNIESGIVRINELDAGFSEDRLSVKPFTMSVEGLALTKLKNLEQFKDRLDSLDSLGELSGSLDYTNESQFRFKGTIRNIKAVFSNRGRRDLQNVEKIEIEAARSGNEMKFEASEFFINNKKLAGGLKAVHNTSTFITTAQLKLSNLILDDKVWEQFTFVDQAPRVEVVWNYRKAGAETHTIKLVADKLLLPGVMLEGLQVDISQLLAIDKTGNSLQVNIKPNRITTDKSFLENDVIAEVLKPENGFKLDSLVSQRSTLSLSGTDWKDINFNLSSYFLSDVSPKSETHLMLRGSVKHEVGLDGHLTMQSRAATSKFELTRDEADNIVIKQLK